MGAGVGGGGENSGGKLVGSLPRIWASIKNGPKKRKKGKAKHRRTNRTTNDVPDDIDNTLEREECQSQTVMHAAASDASRRSLHAVLKGNI